MPWYRLSLLGLVFLGLIGVSNMVSAASFVVAASNSLPGAKARADVVCTGTNDSAILAMSLQQGPLRSVEFDDNAWTTAYSGQSVEWLAGDYYLETSVVLPQVADTILFAQGSILHYNQSTGDAVIITGSLRSKFHFGTIWSSSSGAALAAKDRPYTSPFMPNIMSEITWQGLQQTNPIGTTGIGFHVQKHFVVNKISGFDVRGFLIGVYCDATGGGTEGTIDTNWWWLSYVRACGTDIRVEGGNGSVNSQQWFVNVDASLDGSVAIQTGATSEWWRIIMGDVSRAATTRSIILDENAAENVMEITPPIWHFDGYVDAANSPTNIFMQVPQNQPQPYSHSHLVVPWESFNDGPTVRKGKATTADRSRVRIASEGDGTNAATGAGSSTTLAQKLEEIESAWGKGLISIEEKEMLRTQVLRVFVK